MSLSKSQIQKDFAQVLLDMPGAKVTATIGGTTYTVLRSSSDESYTSSVLGDHIPYDSSLWVKSDGVTVAVNDRVTIDGTDYLVIGKKSDPLRALLRIDIAEEYS